MARVFSNVIGNLSGRLGNLSARITHGHTILAARPASMNVPMDASAIERRSTFLAAAKFALQVVNLPALKVVWNKSKQIGISAFNQVVRENYDAASAGGPTIANIITPDGFALDVPNLLLDADKLTGLIPALTTITVLDPDEVHLSINAVICYHTPLAEGDAPYKLIHLSKAVPNYVFNQEYNLQMDLNVLQKQTAAKYDSSIVYLAVVPTTAGDSILQNSATFVKAF